MAILKRPSDLAEKMLIRLPEGMRDRIAEAATASGRSMNAEVVARLEASFESDQAQKTLEDLQADYEALRAQTTNLELKVERGMEGYREERMAMHRWLMDAIDAMLNKTDIPDIPPAPKFD